MKLFRLFVVACILTFCAGRAAAQEQELYALGSQAKIE